MILTDACYAHASLAGLAVYFYVDPLPHESYKTGQDNKSGDSSETVCSVPPDTIPQSNQNSFRQHWLVQKLFSVIKYMLFGAFVLACNKLRRYVKVHRQRSTSGSSTADVMDVSAGGGRERSNKEMAVVVRD